MTDFQIADINEHGVDVDARKKTAPKKMQ